MQGTGTDASAVTFTNLRTYVVFVRMNPNGTVPSWEAVWNQTEDLTVQTGKTFITTGYSGSTISGYWSGSDQNGQSTEATQSQSQAVTLNAAATSGDGQLWYAWTWYEGQDGVWVQGTGTDASAVTFTNLRTYVVFVRMNPNGTVPSWKAVWNQTEDLTVQTGKTFITTGYSGSVINGYWTS